MMIIIIIERMWQQMTLNNLSFLITVW